MKYCLSIGLHNLFFDIAIANNKHEIISKYKCTYDRNKDISSNIYNAYKKYFANYSIAGVGIGISNNIQYRDEFLYKVTSFNFDRYNLKQSLYKLFKVDIYLVEETYLASLAISYNLNMNSLLYVVLDNKISNSFVINHEIVELEDDINLNKNELLNYKCSKDSLKNDFLINGFDDDYIGEYFLSENELAKTIIESWANKLQGYIKKITKEIPVKNIVFGGYIGEYFSYFKDYININEKVRYEGISNHRELTLLGVSHLIFKDK